MVSPLCPRCAYDLSGTIAAWTDRCPLEGQCAECGLEFAWDRVLALAEHPWLFEYHWRRRPLYRLARTWFAALRPHRFWREVRMTDPIKLRPLGVVVGALLAYEYSRRLVKDPLDSPEFFALKEMLAQQPGNEALKEQIRKLDLHLRQEYFRQRAFTRAGAVLLLVAVVVFFARND